MAVSYEDVSSVVRDWLSDEVTGGPAIADDLPIIEQGILTSLQTVELVLFLEARFAIAIDDDEFTEDNFGSVGAIARLVSRRVG